MAITSVGYGGTVTEDKIAGWRRSFPATYGVVAAGDWAVTLKTGVDRTVGIAAGTAFGHAVTDTNSAEITKQLTTLSSGTRYDLIVARRDWSGSGGATTATFVTGTSSQTATFASRNQTPGTLDDQPLALVKLTGNGAGGVISQIYDLRLWAANGGAVAALNATGLDGTPLVLQYLNEPGTEVWVGNDLWHRYVDEASANQWVRSGSDASPLLDVTGTLAGGTPPAGTKFLRRTGVTSVTTNATGDAAVTFASPFPAGLAHVSVVASDTVGVPVRVTPWGTAATTVAYRPTTSAFRVRVSRADGTAWVNTGFQLWWEATGW